MDTGELVPGLLKAMEDRFGKAGKVMTSVMLLALFGGVTLFMVGLMFDGVKSVGQFFAGFLGGTYQVHIVNMVIQAGLLVSMLVSFGVIGRWMQRRGPSPEYKRMNDEFMARLEEAEAVEYKRIELEDERIALAQQRTAELEANRLVEERRVALEQERIALEQENLAETRRLIALVEESSAALESRQREEDEWPSSPRPSPRP